MTDYRVDSRTLNSLLTTTLDAYSSEMADTIFTSHFTYFMLKQKGAFESQDGGAFVRSPVIFQVNSTAAWYAGYDPIDVTPQDGMTDGIMPWASLAASISISREEERKNSGRSRLIGLLEKKIFQCEESLIEKVNAALYGVGKYNTSQTTKQMAGLQSIIPEVPGSYDLAGLDGDNTWWQNKVKGNTSAPGTPFTWKLGSTTASDYTGITAMRHLYNCCSKGPGGSPTIIVANQYAMEAYEGGLGALQRFSDEKVAGAGFDNVRFRGAILGWDEETCTSTVTKGSTTLACMYFINSKFLKMFYDSQSLFAHEGFVRPENQLARTSLVVFMGNMFSTNRRKLGVLADANVSDVN